MFYDLGNKKVKNAGDNWVAPNASIIGDVTLEKDASIWFNATLRGDVENIYIGKGSNVQTTLPVASCCIEWVHLGHIFSENLAQSCMTPRYVIAITKNQHV